MKTAYFLVRVVLSNLVKEKRKEELRRTPARAWLESQSLESSQRVSGFHFVCFLCVESCLFLFLKPSEEGGEPWRTFELASAVSFLGKRCFFCKAEATDTTTARATDSHFWLHEMRRDRTSQSLRKASSYPDIASVQLRWMNVVPMILWYQWYTPCL